MDQTEKSIWKEALMVARLYLTAAPWKRFANSDILKLNLDGEDVYVMFLGNGGQQYGLSVYQGQKGYDTLFRLFGYMDPALKLAPADRALVQDCLTLELGPVEETGEQEQMNIIKELGLGSLFSKKMWPGFYKYRPYRTTRPMTIDEVAFVTKVVMAATKVAQAIPFVDECPPIQFFEVDEAAKRVKVNVRLATQDTLPRFEYGTVQEEDLRALKEKPRTDCVLEMDVLADGEPYNDVDGELVYMRYLTISIVGGEIIGSKSLSPEDNAGQSMLDELIACCKQRGLPEKVLVRNKEAVNRLRPLCEPLGIGLEIADLDGDEHLGYRLTKEMESRTLPEEMKQLFEIVLTKMEVYTEEELKELEETLSPQEYDALLVNEGGEIMEKTGLLEEFEKRFGTGQFPSD